MFLLNWDLNIRILTHHKSLSRKAQNDSLQKGCEGCFLKNSLKVWRYSLLELWEHLQF